MPITFAPPQPFAPGINQQAGAAQVEQANNGTLASLYEAAGRNRQAAAIAEADRFARNNQVGQQLGEHAQEHADDLQLRRDQFQASLSPHARDVFAAQVGEAQVRQHAEAQAWVHAQDFTFQDDLRLKNQQSAVAEVQRAHDAHEITDQEFTDFVTELRSGIDPAKKRQERALAQQEEAHARQYEAQATRQTEVALKNAELNAKTLEDRTVTVPLPEALAEARRQLGPAATDAQVRQAAIEQGGYSQWVQEGFDQYGHPQWRKVDHPHQAARQKAAEELDTIRLKDYERSVERIEKSIDLWAKQRDAKDAELAKKYDRPPEPLTPEQIHQNFEDAMRRAGLEPTWEAQRARSMGRRGGRGDDVGGGDAPQGKAEMKPFGPDKDANDDQRHQVSELSRQRDVVEKLPIPANLRVQFTAATYAMDALLRKYGTLDRGAVSRMDEQDQKNYDWARKSIDQVSRAGFYGPSAPPPPPGPAYNPMTLK